MEKRNKFTEWLQENGLAIRICDGATIICDGDCEHCGEEDEEDGEKSD